MGTVDNLEATLDRKTKPSNPNSVLAQAKTSLLQQNQYLIAQQTTQTKNIIPLPTKDPGFFKFCRWFSFPHYKGLYQWQKECERELHDAKYQMIVVSRDHGKSIYLGDKCEHKLHYGNYDVLYLGWTDRRKEVAQNICNFFEERELIDNKKSEYHFTLKDGGKFDCYLITSKDTLGMHSFGKQARFDDLTKAELKEFKDMYDGDKGIEDGIFTIEVLENYIKDRNRDRKLLIVIDDPIDDSFMKERHKEEDLERRFMSTIFNINPDQWIFTGTRKFQEDFFDFIRNTFGPRLVEFNRGPYLRIGETRYNQDLVNNPMNLTCPERFTHPELPSYDTDMKEGKRDLDEIYTSLLNSGKLYWWFAEYWNNPHPVTGEVWDHIAEVDMLKDPVNRNYDLCFITIDRATTRKTEAQEKKADYTGCVIGIREMYTGKRIITHDFTDYIDLNDLLIKVNEFVLQFRKMYESIKIILIVETQGGGSDFVTMVRNTAKFVRRDGTTIRNYIIELCTIEELHNTGEKLQRIRDRLFAPVKNERLCIMSMLKQGSPMVRQILSYPHCDKFDAIDAVANSEFIILEKYPIIEEEAGGYIEQITKVYKEIESGKFKIGELEDSKGLNQPEWFKNMNSRLPKRRTVFK